MTIKKLVKWGLVLAFISTVVFVANELFIRNCRIQYAEARVQRNIQRNYYNKKKDFDALFEYTKQLPPLNTIEFRGDYFISELSPYSSNSDALWQLPEHISIDSLKRLVETVDCEAITIHNDKSVSLRYDGFEFCQYEYIFRKTKPILLHNYFQLDNEVYCGENRSSLFCGDIIYKK